MKTKDNSSNHDYNLLLKENQKLKDELKDIKSLELNITEKQIKIIRDRLDSTNVLLIQQTNKMESWIKELIAEQEELYNKMEKINDNSLKVFNEQRILTNFYLNQNNKSLKDKIATSLPSLILFLSFRKFGLSNALKTIKAYRIIKSEGLFDVKYYILNNEYLSNLSSDILLNYLLHEENWYKSPNENFDVESFVSEQKDMPKKLNPFVYYVLNYYCNDSKK